MIFVLEKEVLGCYNPFQKKNPENMKASEELDLRGLFLFCGVHILWKTNQDQIKGRQQIMSDQKQTKENETMNAAQVLVRCLENEGVEYVFGIPGEENLEVMRALKDSKIKFITVRHEQGAAFMADVYGKLKGKAGVCLATLGPGNRCGRCQYRRRTADRHYRPGRNGAYASHIPPVSGSGNDVYTDHKAQQTGGKSGYCKRGSPHCL